MFRHAGSPEILLSLSRLAREELEHYETVLAVLRDRGLSPRAWPPSAYASRLHESVRREPRERALDQLLCASLIEARSCERMALLAANLPEPSLARLYDALLEAEARHHAAYVSLALGIEAKDVVLRRLEELAAREAAVLAALPEGPRLHDGGMAAGPAPPRHAPDPMG